MRIAEEVLFDTCRLSCGRNREEKRKGLTMGNRKGLTLVEVMVVVLVLLASGVAFVLSLGNVRHCAQRVVCGTNLKGLGTAIMVYAHDYDGAYPQLPGKGPWSKRLGFDYYHANADFSEGGAEEYNSRTITASWYLLVREADVPPKSFVCPKSSQAAFEGGNPNNLDITQLWDFAHDPHQHVSYVMQNPYGKFPADETKSAAFAIAADMSPWFKVGNIVSPGEDGNAPQLIKADDDKTWSLGNSWNHPEVRKRLFRYVPVKGTRTGQNVLYGDGHNSYEKRSDVGVRHDGIYTYQSEGDIRIGKNPTGRDEANDAMSEEDSFLGI